MGEIAEMMIEGILCETCGVLMDDMAEGARPPGYPRRCPDCLADDDEDDDDGPTRD